MHQRHTYSDTSSSHKDATFRHSNTSGTRGPALTYNQDVCNGGITLATDTDRSNIDSQQAVLAEVTDVDFSAGAGNQVQHQPERTETFNSENGSSHPARSSVPRNNLSSLFPNATLPRGAAAFYVT